MSNLIRLLVNNFLTKSLPEIAKDGHVAFIFMGSLLQTYANLISINGNMKNVLPEYTSGFDKYKYPPYNVGNSLSPLITSHLVG